MARPLRIIFEGAWYHVMNRGAAKKIIFRSDTEKYIFIELLERISHRYKIEIHAYCLMANHYHLLVRTPLTNLSHAIKYLNGIFAQKINALNNIDGPLFRGRFKTKLVSSDTYLTHLSRYIHLNPVEANICRYPWEYPWSSCRCYLGLAKKKPWLLTSEILNRFQSNKSKTYHPYQQFLLAGNDEHIKQFFAKNIPVYGAVDFAKNIAEQFINTPNDEIPEEKRMQNIKLPVFENMVRAVCDYYNITYDQLFFNKTNLFARNILIYLCIEHCNLALLDVVTHFNGIKKSRVSMIYSNMIKEIKADVQLKDEIERIVGRCGK